MGFIFPLWISETILVTSLIYKKKLAFLWDAAIEFTYISFQNQK